MDMSKLRDTLPAGGRVEAERDLSNDFKAAALSITKLYKSSLAASSSAWVTGYTAALNELIDKCKHNYASGMTLQEVNDWARGRIEALGSSVEPSDEERERERTRSSSEREDRSPRREREREGTARAEPPSKPTSSDDARSRAPSIAETHSRTSTYPASPQSSPQRGSPYSSQHPTPVHPHPQHQQHKPRAPKPLVPLSFPTINTFAPSLPTSDFPFFPPNIFEVDPPANITAHAGSKRRHADSLAENEREVRTQASGGGGRKSRHHQQRGTRGPPPPPNPPRDDPMEENGERERKRRR